MIYSNNFRNFEIDQSTLRRLSALALGVMVKISRGERTDAFARQLRELEAGHELVRNGGGQDFETAALAKGLRPMGEPEKGRRILQDYLSQWRRDFGVATPELAAEAKALGIRI